MSASIPSETACFHRPSARKAGGSGPWLLLRVGPVLLAFVGSAALPQERYPDLSFRMPGYFCHSRNQGERVFGEYLPDFPDADPPVKTDVDLCFGGGQAFGDINGDGRLDEINDMGIFLGHGDGVFGTMPVAFVNQNSPMAFASADLDKDGYDDVLLGTFGIKAFFGGPDGTLRGGEEVLPYMCGDVPAVLRLVDIDGDGFEDILGASNIGPLLAFGRGDGTFEEDTGHAHVFSSRAKLCDLNEDGLLDYVTTGRIHVFPDGFIGLCVSFGKGRGFLEPRTEIPIEGLDYWDDFAGGVTTGDLNRDGHVDVATGGGWGKFQIFFGNGDGTFQPQYTEPLPVMDPPTALLFHDLDLDGFGDLVVAYWHAWTYIYWGVEHGFVDYDNPTQIKARVVLDIGVTTRLRRPFIRGDADDDSKLDLSDVVTILQELFAGRDMVCGDASDADDDGEVRITDAIYLVHYLFLGGQAPAYPYPEAAGDPTCDSGWNGHYGGNLGCSFETFNYRAYEPCWVEIPPSECPPRRPILQYIDVALPGP